MNQKRFNELIDEFIAKSSGVLKSKNHDYATEDAVSNFKRITYIAKHYRFDFSTLPEYGLFMSCMKIDRIMNLLKGNKTPKNEAIEDSFIDLFNYALLAYICYKEEHEEPKKEE